MNVINMSVKSYISVRVHGLETMNPSENKVQNYESVRKEPVNPSGYDAETCESVRNKTVQLAVYPSVNAY